MPLSWLGVAPFLIFALMFLILPAGYLVIGAFQTPDGSFTLQNIANLNQPNILKAYRLSISISAASAFLGSLLGFGLALAIVLGKLPRWVRPMLMTFSGV
ncbi:MAG: acriflavin resistance protein, partial [Rhizobiales bacterium]|nr:acriflavin resistance protein [Hyphomicrobiales bacterium]